MWECSTGSVFKQASTPPLNLPHPISSPPVLLMGYERASLLKHQTLIFLFTQQYTSSSPRLTSPVYWVDFVSELVQLTSWLWVLCRNNSGNLVIFNSSALLPCIIGTFAQIHVYLKVYLSFFPVWLIRDHLLIWGTTVISRSKAHWVSLTIGQTGGGKWQCLTVVAFWFL